MSEGWHLLLIVILAVAPVLLLLPGLGRWRLLGRPAGIVWAGFGLGALAVIVPALAHHVHLQNLPLPPTWAGAAIKAFLLVAPLEEASKGGALLWLAWRSRLLERPLVLVAVGLAIGMGFSTVENIDYFLRGGLGHVLPRLLFALPVHAVTTGLAALFLALAMMSSSTDRRRYGWLALAAPIILHGVYDLPVFANERITADLVFPPSLSAIPLAIGIGVFCLGLVRLRDLVATNASDIKVSDRQHRPFAALQIALGSYLFGHALMVSLGLLAALVAIFAFMSGQPSGMTVNAVLSSNANFRFFDPNASFKEGLIIGLRGWQMITGLCFGLATTLFSWLLLRRGWRRLFPPMADSDQSTYHALT